MSIDTSVCIIEPIAADCCSAYIHQPVDTSGLLKILYGFAGKFTDTSGLSAQYFCIAGSSWMYRPFYTVAH
jgi:hypothetical protein